MTAQAADTNQAPPEPMKVVAKKPATGPSDTAKRANHAALWLASVRANDSQVSMMSVLASTILDSPNSAPCTKRMAMMP